tara:strand:+ start:2100 stop:2909 length:810 start_codon:yes stop_codon:yes gene_type:complete
MVKKNLDILLITGSHPRHQFIARQLGKTGKLKNIICQKRESFIPQIPENIDDETKVLFELHFKKREASENKFFGKASWPDVEILEIEKSQQNSDYVLKKINTFKPNFLLSYGCGILSDEIIKAIDGEAWNIHGGLSPWYKGGITLFWPSYLLQPQMTGMTIHELTNKLDAGDIVHQCVGDLVRGDGLHDLACRSIEKVGKELIFLLQMLIEGKPINKKAHKTSGKLWIEKDWRPEHLKLIYKFYNDQIVDKYLDGEFTKEKPNLHRQFS